jgi:hypothetical protein
MSHQTHEVDHYEIGSSGPSISESAFPEDISLGAGYHVEIGTMRTEIGVGQRMEIGAGQRMEIGAGQRMEIGGRVEIGAETDPALAVKKVIKTARDHRQPAPIMKAVPADAPVNEEEDAVTSWFSDVCEDIGCMIGAENPFPLMTKFLQRFGAGQEKPRFVRVDTEESYKNFCLENSPEGSEYRAMLAEVSDRLDQHIADPHAHEGGGVEQEDLLDAIDEAEAVGAEVALVEAQKQIEMWLPEWAKGKVRAWKEGDFICASIFLPGHDGELRICTSMTPVVHAVEEMESHAAAANVSAAAVVGVLPAMGEVLGAGTLVKEMASAAPSILARPEAKTSAPFVCRIEPKASPTLCAFIALSQECAKGNKAACVEWDSLASAAKNTGAGYVSKAMGEAAAIFKKASR